MKRTRKWTRSLIMALFVCSLIFTMYSVASAEENNGLLRDQGVEEFNSAYEYTVDTERDSVGASAGISFGGWSSLGSSLSYMEFPEGVTAPNGEDGVWCYCIDITTSTKDGHKYSVTTLDAAQYYEDAVSDKIRAILINSYPHLGVEALEQKFGLDDLTEEEAFIATQWILWYYSNPDGLVEAGGGNYYPADIYKPSDYPRENISLRYEGADGNDIYTQSTNVVKLAKALDGLAPAAPYETAPVEVVVEKRIYEDRVVFDFGNTENLEALKNISITVKDVSGSEVPFALSGNEIVVRLADLPDDPRGAGLTVEINAEQKLDEDVYFFSPEGGRSTSQSRVAVFSGTAPIAFAGDFGLQRSGDGEANAQLEVTKKVLLNGEAHRSEAVYYVALFEDEGCTLHAFNGDVREIRMGGEVEGSVTFDGLVSGKTYYVAETDVDGNPLKDGDMGIAVIAYDKKAVTVSDEYIAEVTISNCYEEETTTVDEEPGDEPGGGLGDGDDSDEAGGKGDGDDTAVDTGDDFNVMILMAMMILMTLAMIGALSAVLVGRRV